MNWNDNFPLDGLVRVGREITQAFDLAGRVERGQAQTPLRDHFEALLGSLDAAPFTLTLLGLDAASRAAALGWLCGEDYHVLSVEVPGAVGLVEVQLAERGYVLIKAGRRQEFDRLEPFLEAVRASDLVRQGDASAWLEPMHLEVAAPGGLQGLRLLMPESPSAMAESPTALARLRSESNFLVVAGPIGYSLDAAAVGGVRELAADATATWVLTTGSPPAPNELSQGWPALLGGGTVPSVCLGSDDGPPPVPEFLRESRSGVRGGLFACQQARRFDVALDMLEERIQQDLRQHEARRKMLMRRAAVLNDLGQDRSLHEVSGVIRRAVEERRTRLEAQLVEYHRQRLLPTSVANNQINNLLEDVTRDDIAKEMHGRIVQLGVAPRVRQEVRRVVSDLVRVDLHADLARLNPELMAMTEESCSKLNAAAGRSFTISPETLDETILWQPIEESIHLDSRYRGELAQKGLRERMFEFVMHCRTPVFLMTIVVSPLYSFAPGLRDPLLNLSPVLFIGGAFWAYRGLKEEEHKAAERELIRLRDTLRSEIRRLYEQALGDWNKRAGQHLYGVVNRIGQQADEHLKARVAEMARDAARERAELQDKLKVVDNRVRELGGLAQQVSRIRQAAKEARQILEQATRDAIRDVRQTAKVI